MPEALPPRLVLFPGLGVDARIFEPQAPLPARIEVVEWIAPESPDEPLVHYAHRLAARIPAGSTPYFGGISLGAVMAMEAAHVTPCRGVFAIGGCRSYREISLPFRMLCHAAGRLPVTAVRTILRLGPLALKLFEGLPWAQGKWMTQQLLDNDPVQTRWSVRALMRWELSSPPPVPVWTVHGEHDEIIPIRHVRADLTVPNGRHLISISNADVVNQFLTQRMRATTMPAGAEPRLSAWERES